MSTIPQRLRDIAFRLRKPRGGRPWGADDGAADLLDAIAAELEAPDAVPAQENRHGLVALQCLREEVERAMAPVHAAFAKAKKPAADALPVVAHLSTDKTKCLFDTTIQARGGLAVWPEYTRPLVYQHDHLAAVAALQARINALEARQPPSSAEDEFAVVWPDGGRFIANTLESARNYMSGAVPSCAERGVEPPVIVRYVPAETVPYEPQPDTSKEQP